jgi:hypothetical protein
MLGSAQLEMTHFIPCFRFELRLDAPVRANAGPVSLAGADPARRAALEEVEAVAGRIAAGGAGEGSLAALWTLLVDALAGLERDPGLEVAAVDLYEAAAALQAGAADARRARLLHQATERFRIRLSAA